LWTNTAKQIRQSSIILKPPEKPKTHCSFWGTVLFSGESYMQQILLCGCMVKSFGIQKHQNQISNLLPLGGKPS
jgi:hypothetical protein